MARHRKCWLGRLTRKAKQTRLRRANETPEERSARLEKHRQQQRQYRARLKYSRELLQIREQIQMKMENQVEEVTNEQILEGDIQIKIEIEVEKEVKNEHRLEEEIHIKMENEVEKEVKNEHKLEEQIQIKTKIRGKKRYKENESDSPHSEDENESDSPHSEDLVTDNKNVSKSCPKTKTLFHFIDDVQANIPSVQNDPSLLTSSMDPLALDEPFH